MYIHTIIFLAQTHTHTHAHQHTHTPAHTQREKYAGEQRERNATGMIGGGEGSERTNTEFEISFVILFVEVSH